MTHVDVGFAHANPIYTTCGSIRTLKTRNVMRPIATPWPARPVAAIEFAIATRAGRPARSRRFLARVSEPMRFFYAERVSEYARESLTAVPALLGDTFKCDDCSASANAAGVPSASSIR